MYSLVPLRTRSETEAEAQSRRKEAKREPEWAELLGSWEKHHWKIKTVRLLFFFSLSHTAHTAHNNSSFLSASCSSYHSSYCAAQLRRLALKGIPNSLRGQAWQRLTLSTDLRAAHGPGCYQVRRKFHRTRTMRVGRSCLTFLSSDNARR